MKNEDIKGVRCPWCEYLYMVDRCPECGLYFGDASEKFRSRSRTRKLALYPSIGLLVIGLFLGWTAFNKPYGFMAAFMIWLVGGTLLIGQSIMLYFSHRDLMRSTAIFTIAMILMYCLNTTVCFLAVMFAFF